MTEPTESTNKWVSIRGIGAALYHPAAIAAEAFHLHVEHCQPCQAHIKAMCEEGKRLLEEAIQAMSGDGGV